MGGGGGGSSRAQKAWVYSCPSVSAAPPERVSVADSRSHALTPPTDVVAIEPNSMPATRSLTASPVCCAASSKKVGLGAACALARASRAAAAAALAAIPSV